MRVLERTDLYLRQAASILSLVDRFVTFFQFRTSGEKVQFQNFVHNSSTHIHFLTSLILEQFKKLEDKTGHPKVFFFVGTVALLLVVLSLLGGGKLIFNLVGFIYPAYMSFKSMDTASAGSEEVTQWLTYWVVFSFVNIFETFLSFVVSIIPFYFWIKCGFIVWMWYPQTRGAQTLYDQVIRPTLGPYIKTPTSGKAD